MPAGLVIPSTFTAINRFTAPVRAMENSMRSFIGTSQVGMARLDRGFRQLMSPVTNLQNALRGLGVYIGLFSLIMLLRSAVGVMADFEEAQINIASVSKSSLNPMLAKQARQMAVDYGIAAKEVSNLQYELIKMGLAERKGGMQNVLDATPAITLGARAMKAPVDELSKIIGSGTKLFNTDAATLVDIYAKGLDISALDFESFSTMIRNSQSAWAMAGKGPEELVATLAVLSNAYVHTASAGTGLKNLTIDNAVAAKKMNDQLQKIAKSKDPLVTAYKMYGRKTFQSALPLAKGLVDGDTVALLNKLKTESKGYAESLANIRGEAINVRWQKLVTSYQELILSIDDGNGALAGAVKRYIEIGRAMFLLTADSDAARNSLMKMDSSIKESAKSWMTWIKWGMRIITLLIAIRALVLITNGIMIIARALWFAWSVVLGLAASAGWLNVWALRGNAVALGLLRGVTILATGAQWLWNAALAANPIGLIIVAITALIGYLYLAINAFDSWGATALALNPIFGSMVGFIVTIARHWDNITKAFTAGGIVDGFKAIGRAIMDFLLYPIQQAYELIYKIFGFQSSKNAASMIQAYREQNGFTPESKDDSKSSGIDLSRQRAESFMKSVEVQRQNVKLDINNKSGFPASLSQDGGNLVPIKMSSTFYNFD